MSDLQTIDLMTGGEFEEFVVTLLEMRLFTASRVGGPNDMGIDIVAVKDGSRFAVQCKRYREQVPRTAVSDAVAAKSLHRCDRAMVVTNSMFTPGAVEL